MTTYAVHHPLPHVSIVGEVYTNDPAVSWVSIRKADGKPHFAARSQVEFIHAEVCGDYAAPIGPAPAPCMALTIWQPPTLSITVFREAVQQQPVCTRRAFVYHALDTNKRLKNYRPINTTLLSPEAYERAMARATARLLQDEIAIMNALGVAL